MISSSQTCFESKTSQDMSQESGSGSKEDMDPKNTYTWSRFYHVVCREQSSNSVPTVVGEKTKSNSVNEDGRRALVRCRTAELVE